MLAGQASTKFSNGTTVRSNEAEALSKAILALLTVPALRARLGKSARETIQEEFTLQKEFDANLQVYKHFGLLP